MKGSKSTSKFEISYSKQLYKGRRRSRHYPSSHIIHVQVKSQNNISTISKTPQSFSSSSQRIIYDQNSLSSLKTIKLLDNKVRSINIETCILFFFRILQIIIMEFCKQKRIKNVQDDRWLSH